MLMEGASSCRGLLEAVPFLDLASGPLLALFIIVRICSECVTAPVVSEHATCTCYASEKETDTANPPVVSVT